MSLGVPVGPMQSSTHCPLSPEAQIAPLVLEERSLRTEKAFSVGTETTRHWKLRLSCPGRRSLSLSYGVPLLFVGYLFKQTTPSPIAIINILLLFYLCLLGLCLCLCSCVCVCARTHVHLHVHCYVGGPKLPIYPRLALNLRSSCICFPRARVK